MLKIQSGFTLIELLISIAIIGIMSGGLFSAINPSKMMNKANTAKVVKDMKALKDAIAFYVLDTNVFPSNCRLNCRESDDPLLNSHGVDGWKGPYFGEGVWNRKHPWGGQMGIVLYDSNNNGRPEVWVVLDDDAPGTNYADNTGKVPAEWIQKIDEQVDNGDTSTGDMFLGNGVGPFPEGEAAWRVYRVGEGN